MKCTVSCASESKAACQISESRNSSCLPMFGGSCRTTMSKAPRACLSVNGRFTIKGDSSRRRFFTAFLISLVVGKNNSFSKISVLYLSGLFDRASIPSQRSFKCAVTISITSFATVSGSRILLPESCRWEINTRPRMLRSKAVERHTFVSIIYVPSCLFSGAIFSA